MNEIPPRITSRRGVAGAPVRNVPGWAVIGFFAFVVALLGGSSRPDAVQIAALRPLSALFLIPALYCIHWRELKAAKVLCLLLAVTAVWMAVQLIPLPPSLWQQLPDRDLVANLDRLTDLGEAWRPISLVPSRSLNSLASLIVPATALLLALAFKLKTRDLLLLVAAMGVFDALLGIAQVVTGAGSPLYFYASTNVGSPVGIFANENHSAVFSAVCVLIIVRLGLDPALRIKMPWSRIAGAAVVLTLLIAIMISGSRAGIGMGFFAVAVATIMIYLTVEVGPRASFRQSGANKRDGGHPNFMSRALAWIVKSPLQRISGLIVGVVVLGALFVMNGAAPGLDSAFNSSAAADLRWRIWPVLESMMALHWLVGTGFGSFEDVYNIYEPNELLMPAFLNHAHNDWAQLVIEGGLPMVSILAILLVWLVLNSMRVFRFGGENRALAVFWSGVFLMIMVASIVDYPLRMPGFQAIAIWLLLAMTIEASDGGENPKLK